MTNAFHSLATVAMLAASTFIAPAAETQPSQTQAQGHTLIQGLLIAPNDQTAQSRRAWLKERDRLMKAWSAVLGKFPKKVPLRTEWLAREELPGFVREHVRYQVEEKLFIDGYLLRPNSGKKLPAVVVFHPTTPSHAKSVAGLDPDYPEEKRQGLHLLQKGYVVWCPRNFIYVEGNDWAGNVARVKTRHPDWTGMTRMVWDAIRAVDFLESLSMVDKERIGCLGHSLGGKQVLYAMAFDARYKAGVSSEGGVGIRFSNWDAPWYLGEQVHRPHFKLEHHQILALIAPRAFLLLAGDSADGEKSRAFIDAVKPVYAHYAAEENLGFLNHHLGHRYPMEARDAAEQFLDKHLEQSRPETRSNVGQP